MGTWRKEAMGLPDVTTLFTDARGVVWVGSLAGLFSFAEGRLRKQQVDTPIKNVHAICAAIDGGLWLGIPSTTIIIKALGELGKTKERFAQLIFGVLIIEDILGIAMIALLSGIAMTGGLSIGEVGLTLGKLGLFLAVVLVAGLIIVPRLIGYVARFKSNEMLLVTVLGLCFGVSLLAIKLG